MDFFSHQDKARRHTAKLVLYFSLAVLLIAAAVNVVAFATWGYIVSYKHDHFTTSQLFKLWWSSDYALPTAGGTVFIIFLGSLLQWNTLRKGGDHIAKYAGASPVDLHHKDPKVRRYINVVEEMAIASGVPVPGIYVMEQESGINAFVAGYQSDEAVIVATRGLLDSLSRDELQGVVGHEFSHILNGDMRLNIRLMAMLAGIIMVGQFGRFVAEMGGWGAHSHRYRSSDNDRGGAWPLIIGGLAVMAIGAIGVFFGRLIKAAVSRQREFLADASSVQFTRNPDNIAGALYKIKQHAEGSRLNHRHAEDMSHFCIGEAVIIKSFKDNLATHPPLSERIKRVSPTFMARQKHADRQDLSKEIEKNTAENAQTQQITTLAGAMVASTGLAVSQLVGNPSPDHVDYARRLYKQIPEKVRNLIHGSPGARGFCYGLIMLASGGAEQKILNHVKKTDLDSIEALKQLWPWMRSMPPALRLPIIDILIPVLKRQTPEDLQAFIGRVEKLIQADGEIHLQEWILLSLLSTHLGEKSAKQDKTRFKSLHQVNDELQVLLSALVFHNTNLDKATETYKRVFSSLAVPNTWLMSQQTIDYPKLTDALGKLRQLSYLLKEPVLQACSDVILADEQVNTNEYEFLRVVADILGCPMPPLMEYENRHES